MGFEADRLGLVEPIADFVRPAEGDGKDGGELGDALRVGHVGVFEVEVGHVGVFEVEATGFQGGEEGLDLPALGVDGQDLLGRVVGHDDQQFAGLEMERGDEDGPGLGFSGLREAPGVGEDAAFPGFEVAKQLPRLDHATTRVGDLDVGSDADVKGDGLFLQPCQPGVADEFPVGQEAGDLVDPEEPEDVFEDRDPLLGIGIARLVEHPPAHGNGDGAVDDADHQDVDVAATQPPVGPVHGQPPRPRLEPHHRDQELGEAIVIEIDLLEKPLQAPIVGAGSRAPRKVAGQVREVHRPGDEHAEDQDAKALQTALAKGEAAS